VKGFVKISKYAGMREDLVQAGGGNSSYKINEHKMAIKASGVQLADLTEASGYVLVDAFKIRDAFLKADDLDEMTEEDSKKILADAFIEGKRPSIETFLHAISGRYTLHTHPIVVNVVTCRKNWESGLRTMFPRAFYVPYATPGVKLARNFFKAYRQYGIEKAPEIVFLQNHGLVISADTADEVITKTEQVVITIENYLGCSYESYHRLTNIWKMFPDKIIWQVTDKNVLDTLQQNGFELQHAFCPDCIVFLGKKILDLPEKYTINDIGRFQEEYAGPVVMKHKGTYYIIADSVRKALEIQSVMSFSAQVMNLNRGVECNMLPDREQNYLLNWDAETYRKNIN